MSVYGPIFDYEYYVRQSFAVHHVAQIGDQCGGWNGAVQVINVKVEADKVVQSMASVVSAKAVHAVLILDGNVTEAMAGSATGGRLDQPPLARRVRIGRELQLQQIVHGTSRRTAEDVHGIHVHDGHVRIARYGRAALGEDGGPNARVKVEDVRVGQVARAVVAAEQHHGVAVDDRGGPVAGPGTAAGGVDGAPVAGRKVEPMKVAPVAAVVSPVDVRAVLVHHGRMRMAGTGRRPAQRRHLPPRHAGEVESVKVGNARRPVESAKHKEFRPVHQRHVPIARTGRRTAAGAGQDRTPPPFGEVVGVEIVEAGLAVVSAKDAEGAVE
mmetsp:Transcript_17875/g.51207  ORF Transcript_17875/g.51207 Transcript_17875/m.51207 type:complete len:326 (-) Transcript_17875:560-1537(-)